MTSLDFNDSGRWLLSANSDESLKLYNAEEGTEAKTLLSKKYGCHLARFTHHETSIIYASTKGDDNIRYLSTHDNSYLRYFRGHTGPVTGLALNPGSDTFISCSLDNTLRLWDLQSPSWQGKLELATPTLCAYDSTAHVIAVASPSAATVLLYDQRNYDKAPFATFDLMDEASVGCKHLLMAGGAKAMPRDWIKLEFSNDGKSLVLGTNSNLGHILLDAFDGNLKGFLVRPDQQLPLNPALQRADPLTAKVPDQSRTQDLGQGDLCVTADARYVVGASGGERDLVVWDIHGEIDDSKEIKPMASLPCKGKQGVVEWNPRYNMLATGEKEVMMWLPDEHVANKPP